MLTVSARLAMAQALIEAGYISKPEEYLKILDMELSLEFWLSFGNISQELQDKHPNAKLAAEIKASPLYEALK
jgi:hypothetical protein